MTKMTKLWGALALIFAAGMTWGANYAYTDAVVVWDRDFNVTAKNDGSNNIFRIVPNGNTIQDDGTIKITSNRGVLIEFPSGQDAAAYSYLVKYSNLATPTAKSVLTMTKTHATNGNCVGSYVAENALTCSAFKINNGTETTANYSTAPTLAAGTGYFHVALNSPNNVYLWADATHYNTSASGYFASLTPGANTYGICIGGPIDEPADGSAGALQGLVIESIWIRKGNYAAVGDTKTFNFPSEDYDLAATVSGDAPVAIGALEWRNASGTTASYNSSSKLAIFGSGKVSTTADTMPSSDLYVGAGVEVVYQAANTSTTHYGSGTVTFSGVVPANGTYNQLSNSKYWTGTVKISNKDNGNGAVYPNQLGNVNSFICLNGTSGYFEGVYNGGTCNPALILKDYSEETAGRAWRQRNGGSSASQTIKRLIGDGTWRSETGQRAVTQTTVIKDGSDFGGAFDLQINSCIKFGGTTGYQAEDLGYIIVYDDATVQICKNWLAQNGLKLNGTIIAKGGTLAANTTFGSTAKLDVTAGSLTVASGKTLTLNDIDVIVTAEQKASVLAGTPLKLFAGSNLTSSAIPTVYVGDIAQEESESFAFVGKADGLYLAKSSTRNQPARVIAQNWTFDSFLLESDNSETTLIDGDTVIIPSTMATTIDGHDAWHATDDGVNCPIYGHTVEINREMNWKLPVTTMVVNAQVHVRDDGSIAANANVTGTGTLNFVDETTADGAGTLNVTLAGSGRLTKNGAGTLTISKTNNSFSGGLTVAAGTAVAGAINAFGTGMLTVENGAVAEIAQANSNSSATAYDVTLNGGTLKCKGVSDAHGKLVKSLTLGADSTMEWMSGGGQLIGIGANGQSCTLALANHKLTMSVNGTAQYDRVYLDKVTISSAGTIEVTQGRFFMHCSKADLSQCKLIIGSGATIEVAGEIQDKTLTIKDLVYNGTVTPNSSDTASLTVTGTYEGAGSYSNLTLQDGVTINVASVPQDGVVARSGSLTATGTYSLTVGGVASDAYVLEVEGNTIVAKEAHPAVASLWGTRFTSLEDAISTAIEMATGMELEDTNTFLKNIVLVTPFTAQLPEGYELVYGVVEGEEEARYSIRAVTTAPDYIVISPSSYVGAWQTYVGARAESPVAENITFAVKSADEIYAAYPANAENTNGDPRNDAESIHKYIGMMQKLGTKYFVLGGRWVDVQDGAYDRATLIPGIAVYPKAKKPAAFNLDTIASDLYYACHYKADGQKYVWDPNGDKIYVGLREDSPDSMEDVRHFQPNCVVSRMNFFADTYGETSKSYADLISAYTAKLQRGENPEQFAGSDRYAVWATRCLTDVDGKPDCYPAQKARAEYIPTVRAANEVYFSYLLNTCTEQQAAEARGVILGQDWEVLIPVEHGSAEGLGNLQCDHIKASNKLIKFFMGNVPCMTGQVSANGCFADVALSNPNGGTLVSVNNTSYGYASESGMAGRFCGVSDELVDWCLNSYANGSTAGEAWRYAIASYTSTMLDENGFKAGVLEARGHDGEDDKYYVIAAFLEQELFGDPLVKIQTAKGANTLAVTVERAASIRSLPATSFDAALSDFGKADAKTMSVTKPCTTESVITVPEGKTLEVLNETTLTAQSVTVNGTLVGAGTVNAAITFGANSTLDVSRLAKLTIPAGKDVTLPQAGINFIVPEGTTKIPAVLSLLVCNRADEGDHRALVKSVTAKGSESALTPCGSAAFKLEALNGKIYLVDEGNMIEVPHFLTGLGATVATITIEDKEGNKRELELARDPENPEVILDHYLVPAGSKVVITITPDAEHSGDNQTAEINSAADLSAITGGFAAYTTERAASTVFYNAGTGVEYSGAMANKVVNAEGHNSQILDGDTVVFDRNHAVPTDIVVGADPKGAKLVFEKDVTLTTEQTTPLFTGKAFEIHADHVLTFMPGTTEGIKLGNCTMDKGTAAFAAGGQNNENNIFYLDSIVGTTLLDFRPEVEIRSLNSDNWIHFHTRVTGGATVTGNVRILGDARVIVKRSEYITVTGDVTAQVVDADGNPVAGEYHRLTIDAMDAMVEWWDDNGTPRLKPVNLLKLKDKATADAIVGRINLIAPEVKDENGELILWQLDTLESGMIVMTRLEYDVREGFFTNGILGKDEYADWKYNSAFDSRVTKIQATCPAELKFDFAGAAEGAQITVALPIELSGTGKLTFDVPEGKTVIVTGTISGSEGVRKSGKGTLIFAGTADNTFEGSLVVSEGTVRTTKAHGYSMHRTLSDGTVENPEIDIHTGATLDLGNVCDQDNLTIISAGTITNSVHGATQIGKIKTLTLKGDTTVCGHTFGMAKDSKIVLENHKLTIAMERGECVTTPKPDGTGTEVHDHEFELNNTQVSGGKDNLNDPDIVVVQGTLSCEGSKYAGDVFTKGVNNLGNASLKICKDAAIRLDTDLIVKRIQIVDAMKKVVVPCNVNPDGTPVAQHTHEFEKIWEESVGGGHYGKIIIRQELVGGIKAPRLQLGLESDTSKMLYDVGNDMNSPEIRRIRLNDGEYIDCTEEFIFGIGYPFNAFFEDWTGEAGARRLFHGWSNFADGYSSAEIINPWAVKFTSQDHSTYELTVCDWYPYGSYGFRDVPCACVNTLPLEDQDWAYVLALWPLGDKPFDFANVLMTTITHMDEDSIYKWNEEEQKFELDTDVLKTNNVLCPFCQRGDGSMDFVIAEDWLQKYMGDDYSNYMYEYSWSEAGGNGTISKWINETGENGIERWQSYMLGLDPTRADSLPVLAVRNDVPPSVQKDGKTFVNVKVGGIAPRGYQYISPIYQVEEISVDPSTGLITAGTKTDWQKEPNFEVEVPAKGATDHVKYFRVNVSFEGSDGMNNK